MWGSCNGLAPEEQTPQTVHISHWARNSSSPGLLEAAQEDEAVETSAFFPASKGSSSHQSAQVCKGKYIHIWVHFSYFTASLLKPPVLIMICSVFKSSFGQL